MPGWLKWTLIGCGGLALAAMLGMGACIALLASGPESGVKLPHEMDQYALDYLAEHQLLEPGEELRAYYDATLSMDGTEAAILTDRRVMYHRDGATTAIGLADIVEVDHRQEGIIGDVIEVVGPQGQVLRIEIAPLNDGPAFARALQRARDAITTEEGTTEEGTTEEGTAAEPSA
jgi:hypothetical protein